MEKNNVFEEIEKLHELFKKGVLSEEEFKIAKKELITPQNDTRGIKIKTSKAFLVSMIIILLCVSTFILFKVFRAQFPPSQADAPTEEVLINEVDLFENEDKCSQEQIDELSNLSKDWDTKKAGTSQKILSWLITNGECAKERMGADAYKQALIDSCQQVAWEDYKSKWLSYCEVNNISTYTDKDGEKNCNIDADQADEFERQLLNAKDSCISRYK